MLMASCMVQYIAGWLNPKSNPLLVDLVFVFLAGSTYTTMIGWATSCCHFWSSPRRTSDIPSCVVCGTSWKLLPSLRWRLRAGGSTQTFSSSSQTQSYI